MATESVIYGRMGYEFSTCSAGSEILFKKIIQTFGESSQTGATRYGFEIFVDLNIEEEVFVLKNVYYQFLRQTNNYLLQNVIEPEPTGLTQEEKDILTAAVDEILPEGDESAYLSMLSLADMFKVYLADNKYKMVVLSTIMSYGRDITMSHQCGIIALGAPHNMFLFYEPYGMYEKYSKSYKQCYVKLMSVFMKLPIFSKYKYATYHDYFGLPKGIQKMMLEYGKEHEKEYLDRFKVLKKELVDDGSAPSGKWKYEEDKEDKTFSICDLMDYASTEPKFIAKSAALYFEYNAKTCVSIFLVETAKILILASKTNTKEYISSQLANWYRDFSDKASSVLLTKLGILFKHLYPEETKKEIFDAFANVENDARDICKILVTPRH
jgi:hypothetical protein